MCELLNAEPVWVINSGISFHEEVPTSKIQPWVQASQADNLFEYMKLYKYMVSSRTHWTASNLQTVLRQGLGWIVSRKEINIQ